MRLTYNQSKERSAEARERVERIIASYRESWLRRDGRRLGIDAAAWQGFTLSTHNVASRKEMGAFMLGLLAPVIFVVMVAMGCFYPAVDAMAGERERNTWETLMSSAASRLSVVTAKYLYVASLGGLAGLLNLLAIAGDLRPIFAPLLARAGKSVGSHRAAGCPPGRHSRCGAPGRFRRGGDDDLCLFRPHVQGGPGDDHAILHAGHAAGRVPAGAGAQVHVPLALLPVVNVTLMVREAFSGPFPWAPIAGHRAGFSGRHRACACAWPPSS